MSNLHSQGLEIVPIGGIDNARLGGLCKALSRVNAAYMQRWSESNPAPPPYQFARFEESEHEDHLEAVKRHAKKSAPVADLIPNLIMNVLNRADKSDFVYTKELAIFQVDIPRLYFRSYTYPDEPTYTPDTIKEAIAFDGFGATEAGKLATRTALDEVIIRSHKIDDIPPTYGTLEPEIFEPYLYVPTPAE